MRTFAAKKTRMSNVCFCGRLADFFVVCGFFAEKIFFERDAFPGVRTGGVRRNFLHIGRGLQVDLKRRLPGFASGVGERKTPETSAKLFRQLFCRFRNF